MTHTTQLFQGRDPLTNTAQLRGVLEDILKAALQRQIWLLFLGTDNRLIDPIMPMNDHPDNPHELFEIEDLGRVTFPEVLAHRTREIARMIGAPSFVVVWERPGNTELTDEDRSWGEAITRCTATCDPRAAQLRAMFLMHDDGIRLIADFQPEPDIDEDCSNPNQV